MARTRHPVVLIHGVFGYGRSRPFWNRWQPYWPERELQAMHARCLVVDVGALSSDHDRACEAFFQLFGGRVDYGDDHAARHGHARFGETFDTALHPQWSAENPVHLVGHSVGATTAIELYQLICTDAFGVGSDHRWVRSIVSIAGPLSGTTLTHFFGLHEATMVPWTLGHAIGASLSLWLRLQRLCPWLKGVYDFRMPQWEPLTSFRDILMPTTSRVLMSPDLAVYDILPARRQARNKQLVDMEKLFLVSVVTASSATTPVIELALVTAIVGVLVSALLLWSVLDRRDLASSAAALSFVLWLRLRKRIFLPIMQWRMRRCVRGMHKPYAGFERSEWEANDGAVNLCSMAGTGGSAREKAVGGCRCLQHDDDSDSEDTGK
ncbi:hypothetical protein P43SY_012114 [Pythium insidiosum]|uniref:Lipase-like C-terminal domain-containing protein n=1 Tax=Pythium insidiosum TaxID=114742 RepID=A0AAD5Q2N6_PYTIN|nr:hypothetical protein P43SY_012114 [Pythium insidiosum]